jgi:hypothetical protein
MYLDLLALLPGTGLDPLQWSHFCCINRKTVQWRNLKLNHDNPLYGGWVVQFMDDSIGAGLLQPPCEKKKTSYTTKVIHSANSLIVLLSMHSCRAMKALFPPFYLPFAPPASQFPWKCVRGCESRVNLWSRSQRSAKNRTWVHLACTKELLAGKWPWQMEHHLC